MSLTTNHQPEDFNPRVADGALPVGIDLFRAVRAGDVDPSTIPEIEDRDSHSLGRVICADCVSITDCTHVEFDVNGKGHTRG